MDSLPQETVAHIQSAGCNLQKKSVIGAHNRCWKYLIGAISIHGEANRSLEILGGDKDSSDDMLSSRDVFLSIIGLLRLLTFTFEDTSPMLPECLCGHIFRFGL